MNINRIELKNETSENLGPLLGLMKSKMEMKKEEEGITAEFFEVDNHLKQIRNFRNIKV